MFNSDILRRLDKLDEHIAVCDSREQEFRVCATEITGTIRALNDSLSAHMKAEEKEAKEQADSLKDIATKLTSIDQQLVAIPKDVDLKLQSTEARVKEYIAEELTDYATRNELNNGLNSIRAQAKWIWTTLATVAISAAWVIERFT